MSSHVTPMTTDPRINWHRSVRTALRAAGIIPAVWGFLMSGLNIYMMVVRGEYLRSGISNVASQVYFYAHYPLGCLLGLYFVWAGLTLMRGLTRRSIRHFSIFIGWFGFREFGNFVWFILYKSEPSPASSLELLILPALGIAFGYFVYRYSNLALLRFASMGDGMA